MQILQHAVVGVDDAIDLPLIHGWIARAELAGLDDLDEISRHLVRPERGPDPADAGAQRKHEDDFERKQPPAERLPLPDQDSAYEQV
ncbi:hypothetical protein [Povalibacter sp.]|uniref:hypothetical protein n=1 Tax=Povalibacter sp. TaxID=1962978 RepID=UPI002D1FB038|nr:hypothetical protein [Povalibacter sp.]